MSILTWYGRLSSDGDTCEQLCSKDPEALAQRLLDMDFSVDERVFEGFDIHEAAISSG